jgi:gluconokinase
LDVRFSTAILCTPPQNIEKMSGGIPLTDADHFDWLSAIHGRMVAAATRSERLIVACSALKQSYRTLLADGLQPTWVYLKASPDLIRSRLRQRTDHLMKVDMEPSQFATLEAPSDAIVVDASQAADVIVRQVSQRIGESVSAAQTEEKAESGGHGSTRSNGVTENSNL